MEPVSATVITLGGYQVAKEALDEAIGPYAKVLFAELGLPNYYCFASEIADLKGMPALLWAIGKDTAGQSQRLAFWLDCDEPVKWCNSCEYTFGNATKAVLEKYAKKCNFNANAIRAVQRISLKMFGNPKANVCYPPIAGSPAASVPSKKAEKIATAAAQTQGGGGSLLPFLVAAGIIYAASGRRGASDGEAT